MIYFALSQSHLDRVFVSRQRAVNLFSHPVTVTSTRSSRLTALCVGDKAMAQRMDQKVRLQVFKRDNYTCRYCGDKTGPFHADHVYPYSKGGETSINNMVTACRHCNVSKHNKVGRWPKPVEYFEEKKQIHKEASFELKRDAAYIFVSLLGSGILVSFMWVLPYDLKWQVFRVIAWFWFIYSLLCGAYWVYDFLREE